MKKNLNSADIEHFIKRIAEIRHASLESLESYKQMMVTHVNRTDAGFDINAWATKQLYIALGTFLTSAAILGIDACPMEGLDPAKYDEILGLEKQGYHAVVVATAGYRAADDAYASAPKVRYPREEVVANVRN
jgi:nitroreductase